MKPTKQTLMKYYERVKKLNPNDLNDIMKWCYYSVKALQPITERRLSNFGVSEENLNILKSKKILSLMKDGKSFFFTAYEFCKNQAEIFSWDKALDNQEQNSLTK